VEIVTGIDPSLPVNLIPMAPPFLGSFDHLEGRSTWMHRRSTVRSFSR